MVDAFQSSGAMTGTDDTFLPLGDSILASWIRSIC